MLGVHYSMATIELKSGYLMAVYGAALQLLSLIQMFSHFWLHKN